VTLVERRPTGLLRLLLRAPAWVYRAGAGRLLGHRFLYLAHTGRSSGRRRDVVLEVARFDRETPEAFVVSAWGVKSDWFRNISAAPPLEVRIGSARWRQPRHRVLDAAEVEQLLRDYADAHPRAWRALAPRLGLSEGITPAAMSEAAARFPAVAFRP
jgi:deazaflavin-dependent oxidoreductase (nitroreductase family)